MPVSFDWDFQEDESDDSQPAGWAAGEASLRRRWLIRGTFVLILFGIVAVPAGLWIKNQLDAVKKAEVELREAVDLELRTIADGDAELFRSRQDPADSRWTSWQVVRYIRDRDRFVPAPGLTPAARRTEIEDVHILGDTGRAELTHWFIAPQAGFKDPLPFRTTWFYRQNDDGVWYHVAPPDNYWGVPYSWHGNRLVIKATEAEASVLDPVARDFAVLVSRGCQLVGCSDSARYTLSFEGELTARAQGDWWTLPAPHIAGLPGNERARDAWEQSLKLWLADTLVRVQAGRRDLDDRLIYRELVERFRSDLGLLAGLEIRFVAPDVELLSQALRGGRQHTLQDIWLAEQDSEASEEMRLFETEIAFGLQWVEDRVGRARLFQMLPAMGEFDRVESALSATYDIAILDFEAEWFHYLNDVAGGVVATASLAPSVAPVLNPPPMPPRPVVPPGDHIAFVCNDRLWVGNADGSSMVPLTTSGQRFGDLHWSPDGKWLLTVWHFSSSASALYLKAADGSRGRLLTNSQSVHVLPVGWSPDGSEAVYYAWSAVSDEGQRAGVWAYNLETGETRQLPGIPVWAPDGKRVAYVADPAGGQEGPVWLADADWGNARKVADHARLPSGGVWAPDGFKLALVLDRLEPDNTAVAVFDLNTGRLESLITAADLTDALLSWDGDLLSDGTDPIASKEMPLRDLVPVGWSADGSLLRVWGQAATPLSGIADPTVEAVVALDGSRPRLLAFGSGVFTSNTPWSPSNPDRLVIAWPNVARQSDSPSAYLYDLEAGTVYTATQTWQASWSRDGVWVAFPGPKGITIVDQSGRERAALEPGPSCTEVAWNPAADLSALSNPVSIAVVSASEEWSVDKVRVYHDALAGTVHVWGEVQNKTGEDTRVIALVPVLWDRGRTLINGERWLFTAEFKEMISSASLPDGSSLPFRALLVLPNKTRLKDGAEVEIRVAAVSAEPDRTDLDISSNEYETSALPHALRVNGVWENAGPDLSEYALFVVTVYDVEGKVMGWSSLKEKDLAILKGGRHEFQLEINFLEPIVDLNTDVGSYKIQLFGR